MQTGSSQRKLLQTYSNHVKQWNINEEECTPVKINSNTGGTHTHNANQNKKWSLENTKHYASLMSVSVHRVLWFYMVCFLILVELHWLSINCSLMCVDFHICLLFLLILNELHHLLMCLVFHWLSDMCVDFNVRSFICIDVHGFSLICICFFIAHHEFQIVGINMLTNYWLGLRCLQEVSTLRCVLEVVLQNTLFFVDGWTSVAARPVTTGLLPYWS